MKKVELTEQEALLLYSKTNDEGKQFLAEKFGAEMFSSKITDRVKTIQDVLSLSEISDDLKILIDYTGADRKMIGAKNFVLALLIAEILNEGWVPDWNDGKERKWYGYFDGRKGFEISICIDLDEYATTSSGLFFKSQELLQHAFTCFPQVYKEMLST